MRLRCDRSSVLFLLLCSVVPVRARQPASGLPDFGRDTVLMWKIRNLEYKADFVVRIAQFLPDRYIEWEDDVTQGTVFMPGEDIEAAKGYVNSNLFKSGSDTKGHRATTLWLSRNIYRELKANKKAKCVINGSEGRFAALGEDALDVEVNRKILSLPVLKVMDDRKEERWFLDVEDNPLMVFHRFRHYSQTLTGITTDRPNTLRWIKGKKLAVPPH